MSTLKGCADGEQCRHRMQCVRFLQREEATTTFKFYTVYAPFCQFFIKYEAPVTKKKKGAENDPGPTTR